MILADLWQARLFGNTLGLWTAALSAAVLAGGTLVLLRRLVVGRLRPSAHQTDTLLDDVVLDMAHRTGSFFCAAVGVAVGTWLLDLPDAFDAHVRTALLMVALLQAGRWGHGIVQFLVIALVDRRACPGDRAAQTGRNMLRFLGILLVWGVTFLLCLDNLGINITTLVAGLGVTGVAVALATQNIVSDLFASVSILLDKPFLVGDFIIVDNFLGTVERIGVRSTKLRSLSGEGLVLANSDLTKSRIRNYKHLLERRIVVNFTLRYETAPEAIAEVPELVRQAVQTSPKLRFDRAHLASFGEFGLVYEVVFYVTEGDYTAYMDGQQQMNYFLLQAFAARGIRFAYRTQVVYDGGPLPAPGGAVAAMPKAATGGGLATAARGA